MNLLHKWMGNSNASYVSITEDPVSVGSSEGCWELQLLQSFQLGHKLSTYGFLLSERMMIIFCHSYPQNHFRLKVTFYPSSPIKLEVQEILMVLVKMITVEREGCFWTSVVTGCQSSKKMKPFILQNNLAKLLVVAPGQLKAQPGG